MYEELHYNYPSTVAESRDELRGHDEASNNGVSAAVVFSSRLALEEV